MKKLTIEVPEGVDRFTVILGDGFNLVTNEEKKDMEKPPRWRADIDGIFYRVNAFGQVCENIDEKDDLSEGYYNIANYFKTKEAAGKVAEQIREILKNSKAE